ncbi:MAG: universal stress protein [Synergistaceae bacterium]|nr:universal stress protein [Synergistaceae bacterium]
MKILIAVDFSQIGREAAFRAYRYAMDLRADVTFLHIVPSTPNVTEGYNLHFFVSPEARATEAKVREAAEQQLRRLADDIRGRYGELPHSRYDWRVEVAENAGTEIVRIAERDGYDVIVIGNKGYSTLERMLLGSTALKVINQATCSVWLYKHTEKEDI